MNTTNLFVELVVIGVSALAWFLLLVISLFGVGWIPYPAPITLPVLFVFMPLVYVLGIVTDRFADTVFEWIWADRMSAAWFPEKRKYYRARREILVRSRYISDLLEYGRTRLRICRGWALNLVLDAVFLNLLIWIQFSTHPWAFGVAIFGTITLLFLALACWYAWRLLLVSEYKKIKDNISLEPAESSGLDDTKVLG